MKILLSPAKKLDFTTENSSLNNTNISFPKESTLVMDKLSSYSALELSKLMKLSTNLSILNKERNDKWSYPFNDESAKQALFTFKGEVYQNMRVEEFSNEDLDFANKSIRILSGLYGILNPSDLILPYRLEMGTKLEVGETKNLYNFWQDILTEYLIKDIKKDSFIINLASDEYFKVIDSKRINIPIITPIFKDTKNGKVKVISFFAKRARGEMCNYIVKNRISSVSQIKEFNRNGYAFSEENSTETRLVFIR
tara:strand:+ start:712 stop:1470 length:759 start_codon:yes stop_codon:yes gene_type:complete